MSKSITRTINAVHKSLSSYRTFWLATALFFFPFSVWAQNSSLHLVIQKGHQAVVKASAYSPDGKLLATASRDKTIKIWDVASQKEIMTLLGHKHTVNEVVFSRSGHWLASSSADNTVKIWEVKSGKLFWTSPIANQYMTTVAFSPDEKQIAIGGYGDVMVVHELSSGDTITTIKVNPEKGLGYGLNLAYNADGTTLAIGQDDRELLLYNTRNWELQQRIKPNKGWWGGCISFVNFSQDGQWMAKAAQKGAFEIQNLNTHQTDTLKYYTEDIVAIQFNSSSSQVLIANEDSVFVYTLKDKSLITAFKADVKEINDADFHPTEEKVLLSGNNNRASLWNYKGELLQEYKGILNDRDKGGVNYDPNNYWQSHIAKHIQVKNELLLTNDAKNLIRGKIGKKARMWNVATAQVEMEYIGHDKAVLALALSQDEKQLFTADAAGVVKVWGTTSGKLLLTYKNHREPIFDLALSNDGKLLATVAWDGYVVIKEIESGKQISRFYLENVSAYNISFSPNDYYLVLAKLDKTLELWEIDTQQKVRSFIGHEEVVTAITWDSDHRFFTTAKDGKTILWDMNSGLIQKKFRQDGAVYAVNKLSDKLLLTGGEDRKVKIWDLEHKTLLRELEGHQAAITSINVNVKHNLLVTGDLEGVIKFWKLDTYELFFEQLQIGINDWMVYTQEGQFYATEGAMQNIHFVKGLQTYELGQFFEEFYKPNLLEELFETKDANRDSKIQKSLGDSPPPSLHFGLFPQHNETEAILKLKVEDHGGGVKNMQLFHNGKNLHESQYTLQLEEKGEGFKIYTIKAKLVSGHNVFAAKAYSKGNIGSAPAEVDILAQNTLPGGKCYVLTIGVNAYQNPKLNLNYARQDAVSFAEKLKTSGQQIYSGVEVVTLLDEKANKTNILNSLDSLSEVMNLNDVFVFYFAGHGSIEDDKFYLLPTDATRLYDANALDKQAIETSVLQEKFRSIPALKQVIILDACQSGKSIEVLSMRGAQQEKAIAQLSRSAGMHVLASAGSEQYAGEYADLQHGLFTYMLLEALSGKADGANQDGKVTVFEIKSYLDDQVPEFSLKYKGKPQYPYSFSRGHDFPLIFVTGN